MSLLYFVGFYILILSVEGIAEQQSYAVKGKLLCGVDPAFNVRVKLWDKDFGFNLNDLLAQAYTDNEGNFHLTGDSFQLTTMKARLSIIHDCNDALKPGSRRLIFDLPDSYITPGNKARKTFDLGRINLETKFHNEEREMVVSKKRKRDVEWLI